MNRDVLNFLGITHIINITQHIGNQFENDGIQYLSIKIEDRDSYQVSPYFRETYNFIETALFGDEFSDVNITLNKLGLEDFKEEYESINSCQSRNKLIQLIFKAMSNEQNKNRILIHCSMGVSRSPTMCIMYLMKKLKITLNDVKKI